MASCNFSSTASVLLEYSTNLHSIGDLCLVGKIPDSLLVFFF